MGKFDNDSEMRSCVGAGIQAKVLEGADYPLLTTTEGFREMIPPALYGNLDEIFSLENIACYFAGRDELPRLTLLREMCKELDQDEGLPHGYMERLSTLLMDSRLGAANTEFALAVYIINEHVERGALEYVREGQDYVKKEEDLVLKLVSD
jgi:hypothetical protein